MNAPPENANAALAKRRRDNKNSNGRYGDTDAAQVTSNGSLPTLKTLPSLMTDCVPVGHANKADVVFTPRQWFAMCSHMMNENPENFFLMPYRDKKTGKAEFKKAYSARAGQRIEWAWDTITGRAKSPASIGFYPTNAGKQSRWAAMDFDIHDGDRMRARDFAHKAFALLIREPQLFVALTTSAGDPQDSGWHVFIFTRDFYLCDEWSRLLRQVADQIGAPVQSGICEIFPNGERGVGKGIRAPGTWNPKNGECGLVLRETVTKLLPVELPGITPKESNASLGTRRNTWGESQITPSREFYRAFPVTAPRSRHGQLSTLIGTIFHQIGREVARLNAEAQYVEASPAPVSSLAEHLAEFEDLWSGMERKWRYKLSKAEREKFDALEIENDRDAFRIIRNWKNASTEFDFKVVCASLANRLGVTLKTASNIRQRFCALGILKKTASYQPHKLAARYKWLLPDVKEQPELLKAKQSWSDPGDVRLKQHAA
jgi:hypothetical protein